MKKRSLLIITVLLAVLVVSIATVSAKSDSPGVIDCVMNITYDVYPDGEYWLGNLEGCEIAGKIKFEAVLEEYDCPPGNTIHFVEEFTIESDSGGEIKGKNWGVWNLKTAKFSAHGWVTATDGYEDLVGNQYSEMGMTSTTEDTVPITAFGASMRLAPGNRPPGSVPESVPQHPCFPDA